MSIVNALWLLLTGERFDLEDPKLTSIVSKVDKMLRLETNFTWKDYVMSLISTELFKKNNKTFNAAKEVFTDVKNLVSPSIAEHEKNYDEDNLEDFLDVYLAEIKKTKDPKSSFYQRRGMESLTADVMDLFLAGKEVT